MSPNALGFDEVCPSCNKDTAGYLILVAGRDPFSTDLLATAISRSFDCRAVSVSASALLKTVANISPTMVIISADLSTIPGEGYALASAFSRTHPETGMIVLISEASPEAVIRAFQSGATGVFCQEEPMTELLHCIQHVAMGVIWAGKKATATVLETFKNIPSSDAVIGLDAAGLTPRELEVIKCAATGKTNKSIAAQLRLSEHTVKNYMFRAFSKLGVSSRVELLFYLALRGHSVGSLKSGCSPPTAVAEPIDELERGSRQNAPIVLSPSAIQSSTRIQS